MKIAINGFGRIGRAVLKAYFVAPKNFPFQIVAVNDLTDPGTLAHLLRYDSCSGRSVLKIKAGRDFLNVSGQKIQVLAEKDPVNLPWRDLEADLVIESTGRFRRPSEADAHLRAGAKKVIISAPAKDGVKTIVLGVNEEKIKKSDQILSMASCTTNCLAPIMAVIQEQFGVRRAAMTTIHSYTADQNLVDGPHKDLRRARAAAQNIVPTTTGAATAVAETIPGLKGIFGGLAVRVPTPLVSLCDLVVCLKKKSRPEDINSALTKAAANPRWKNILAVSQEPLVSSDLIGHPASAIVDLPLTAVIDGDLAKIIAWYDNEWGYANRLLDLCGYINKKSLQ
ncbi:type I glyceraldehyde-3-phosphate dehydrogenase [Candidatus Falkowbacteria bacterium CG_4_10_14_0_2_um_filter_48_10]|uniref:Glyceraldehyde-3-phosphate dehydrogenase n=1 Tax=Candidatus Falkowbacteria bacterium CG23_combo_of_CG06-09_8_20_14_all_49_15 TaxID=1974572 RepID=A0A2G9ZK36_9BACT|nr:MAG: type I glyceraldehyde-3-phosphate dehydrogenase [Candidatus Falkowbacteria bacterium CG23_combo_of_CG06-09_8_20_14_all_49_15]PJA07987.1 MAG: type I glyceraldehyde-3-phosphate dehydrogenase [Candidatus Falkowbacteria bacterium CG_4_10_14_0_2_um_filter_48_10]